MMTINMATRALNHIKHQINQQHSEYTRGPAVAFEHTLNTFIGDVQLVDIYIRHLTFKDGSRIQLKPSTTNSCRYSSITVGPIS